MRGVSVKRSQVTKMREIGEREERKDKKNTGKEKTHRGDRIKGKA